MRARALDQDGDWTFGRGRSNYLTDAAAVALMVQTRLYMVQGDCFFDADGWIDWFNLLGTAQRAALLFSIRAIIASTPGVARVDEVAPTVDARRRMTASYAVTTVFGTPIFGQVFQVPPAPYTGVSKFVQDVAFTGQDFQDVDTSLYLRDATRAVWMLYEVTNGYTPVVGAVQPLDASHVRINLAPAGSGTFRLVGVA